MSNPNFPGKPEQSQNHIGMIEIMYKGTEELRENALAKIAEALGPASNSQGVMSRGAEIMQAYTYWKHHLEAHEAEPTDILPRTLSAIHAMAEMEATCGANLMNDADTVKALDGIVSRVGDYWLVKSVAPKLLNDAVIARQAEHAR